jgi:hypothetical protein
VSVRCLDAKGKPLKNYTPQLHIVFAPGAIMAATVLTGKDDKDLEGDWGIWVNYDRKHHVGLASDDEGRITFPNLIPGAPYQITSFDFELDFQKGFPKEGFRVEAGQTLNLPDFVVKK